MEQWVCHDAKGKSVYYRRITGFQTTGQPCGEEEFHVTVEEGKVFNETWPSTKNWSTKAERPHPSPPPRVPATPVAPPPSTPTGETPPRSNNFH